MRRYGLIGHPVRHSLSAQLFGQACAERGIEGCEYELFDLAPDMLRRDALRRWVGEQGLKGFNVTMPYKRDIMGCMDCLSDEVQAIGAVNCVAVERGEDCAMILTGHNTDAQAFGETLAAHRQPYQRQALILGTGGAARAVAYAMRQMEIGYRFVSRRPHEAATRPCIGYDEAAAAAAESLIIVNATPVGTSNLSAGNPWPAIRALTPRHLCYDLVYNPSLTPFLAAARERGSQTMNGWAMLRRQATLSYRIWGLAV